MSKPTAQTVICSYKVKPGKEREMESLLAKHWPTLHELGLVTERRPQIFRGLPSAKPGGAHSAQSVYIEIFEWADGETGPQSAHQSPAVLALWEPMGACCEHMDFPHYEPLDLLDG